MKIVGRGKDREEAERDAREKAKAKGRVVLAYGSGGYVPDVYESFIYEIEVTTVKPGWFMRDVKEAARRAKMWRQRPRR